MKTALIIAAAAGTLAISACATATPFTFENLDQDQNGLVALADVSKADNIDSSLSIKEFDTDGDAQLNIAEFNSYLSSDFRQTALAAEAQRREIQRTRQLSRSASSGGGGGGSYGS